MLETTNALVVRTDFSDETAWVWLCAAIRELVGDFKAYVDCISDPTYEGMTPAQFLASIPRGSNHTFLFIVDRVALVHQKSDSIDLQKKNLSGRDKHNGIPYSDPWLTTTTPELEISRGHYDSL